MERAVAERIARGSARPLVVGICGAQGSGKSTLCGGVAGRLRQAGLAVAVLSLDDLYLTRGERERLARDRHPLFRTRGVPGTHDVALGLAVLDGLGREGEVLIPRFDKAADDRSPPATWERQRGPADIVLFEGWCVGARPQDAHALAEPVNALEAEEDRDGAWRHAFNAALAGEYQRLFARIDMLVLLAAPDFAFVRRWRGEAEAALRAGGSGPATMDDAALDRFVSHYERLTRHILAEMPARADLVIRLDAARRPVSWAANG